MEDNMTILKNILFGNRDKSNLPDVIISKGPIPLNDGLNYMNKWYLLGLPWIIIGFVV